MTYRNPTPVRRSAFIIGLAALSAGLLATLLTAGGASAEPSLADRRAQADQVLAQIQEIDSEVSHAAEAFNLANVKLGQIEGRQKRNARLLGLSKKNLARAQALLEQRLVAIYTSGDTSSAVDVLLRATSIEDLLNRLEEVDRVSEQDAEVLRQVTSFKRTVQKQKRQLAKARTRQERIVAERAAQRRAIEAKLAEREALLASIKDEIAEIQERERRRQLALARQARARVQAQQLTPDAGAADAAQTAVAAATEAVGAAPAPRYGGVVGIAMQYLGVPYRWGGASPSGFDCSGFIMYVYAKVGVSLPHNAAMQYGHGAPVSRSELAPGDLVFFNGLGHNGLYIGGGQFIHAPHTGDVVKISSLSQDWYARTYVGARRP